MRCGYGLLLFEILYRLSSLAVSFYENLKLKWIMKSALSPLRMVPTLFWKAI